MNHDAINPRHYFGQGLQAIEVIEAFDLPYHRGSVIKYILRAGHKVSTGEDREIALLRDLKKAAWFLDREIQRLESILVSDNENDNETENDTANDTADATNQNFFNAQTRKGGSQ